MKIVALIIFFVAFSVSAAPVKMPAKWHKINNLINQEIKTILKVRKRDANLEFRLLELYSERIALLREKENKEFLGASYKLRKKHPKSYFFKKSTDLYSKTLALGNKIIKKFPNNRYKTEIYYTLALNSRDFSKDGKTEQFLLKSLSSTRGRETATSYNAKVSLAEHYYNEKKYKKAIQYYKQVVRNRSDEWYSKHLFNYSWCLFKTRRYDEAISNVKVAYKYSRKKKYISLDEQILNSLGVFYLNGGRVKEAVSYYLKNVPEATPYLFSFLDRVTSKGSFSDISYVLVKTLSYVKSKKDKNSEIKLRSKQLEIYRKFKKEDLYFLTAKKIYAFYKKNKIDKDVQNEIIEKMKSFTGFLQVRLTNNAKKNVRNYSVRELKRIISYLNILSFIDNEKASQYRYLKGEMYYAVNSFSKAAKSYISALQLSKKRKKSDEDDLRKKLVNSLLVVLSEAKFDKKTSNKYTIYTYSNYLLLWPKGEKAKDIYQNLFNLYMATKNVKKALLTLNSYNSNYPKDVAVHRNMFINIFDYYIAKKDSDEIASWITKMNKGYLSFDLKFRQKAELILARILFEKYQKMDKMGKKEEAIKGYISLFSDKRYPDSIKAKSAFYISVLYLELYNVKLSYDWFIKSTKHYKDKELYDQVEKLVSMSVRYHLLQDFETSLKMSNYVFTRYCQRNFKSKYDLYNNIVYMNLINDDYKSLMIFLRQNQKCKVDPKVESDSKERIIKYLAENRRISNFFNFTTRFIEPKLMDIYFEKLTELYWDSLFTENKSLSSKIYGIFDQYKSSKDPNIQDHTRFFNLALNFREYRKTIYSRMNFRLDNKPKFDENLFNSQLESNLLLLKQLTDSATPYIQSGDPGIVLSTYKILSDSYNKFGEIVNSYTPQGVPPEFVKGFKGQMNGLSNEILGKGREYLTTARRALYDNDVLSVYNREVSEGAEIRENFGIRYPASFLISPMDTIRGVSGGKSK